MACRFYEILVGARLPGGIRFDRDLYRIYVAARTLLADTRRHTYLCQSHRRRASRMVACWRAGQLEVGRLDRGDFGCNSVDSARGNSKSINTTVLGRSERQLSRVKRKKA